MALDLVQKEKELTLDFSPHVVSTHFSRRYLLKTNQNLVKTILIKNVEIKD
jgi:hypothetical protein